MHKSKIVLLFVVALAGVSLACSTPVFRYAIERWEADPYRLIIFTDGELTTEQQQTIKEYESYERYGFRYPPLMVQQAEVSAATNLSATVWADVSTNCTAPAVALLYPSIMRDNSVVWIDDLSSNALNRIIMSPARLETATRLLAGDAAVWLLIKGDDSEENRLARELLDATLKELEDSTVYNEDFLQLAAEAGTDVPELRFSVLEVDPDDPGEAVLMAMLTHLSPDAAGHPAPVVVPVFGQGRGAVLMMNEFIAEEYIERVAEFLTGACSCEVKALNPGFDLLIPVDWIGGITEEYVFDAVLPPLTGPATLETLQEPPTELLPPVPEKELIKDLVPTEKSLLWSVLSVFAIVALGAVAFTGWLLLRKNH